MITLGGGDRERKRGGVGERVIEEFPGAWEGKSVSVHQLWS